MNAPAIAPAVAPAIAPAMVVPAGADWKRFAIFRLDRSGRPELLADTNLPSEADRFEALGYLVSPTLDPTTLSATLSATLDQGY